MECCKTHLYLFPGHLLEPPGEAFNIVTHCSPSHVPREGLENQRVGRLLRNCFQHGIDLSSTSLSKGRHWNEKNCIRAWQTAKNQRRILDVNYRITPSTAAQYLLDMKVSIVHCHWRNFNSLDILKFTDMVKQIFTHEWIWKLFNQQFLFALNTSLLN